MYEPDPGAELCVPCQAFFEAGHADQYDANFTGIEYGAYLFKATYSETTARHSCRSDQCCQAPNTAVTNSAFGMVTATSQWPRTIQMSLKLVF